MALNKRCPCHGNSSWELVQAFYMVLNNNEQNMVDITLIKTFMETYTESMQFKKRLVQNWAYQKSFSNNSKNSTP